MKKIGYLGPKGTFSYEAVLKYIKDKPEYTGCDYNSIAELILAVDRNELDEAIVPIENSLEGAINVTLDVLAFEVDLKIKDEVVIDICANLMVKKGTLPENIRCILSHPQPLGQCRKFISSNYPNVDVKSVYSTAGAAETVAEGTGDLAAIGSSSVAGVYGLDIIASNIQDGYNNRTRFVVISKNDGPNVGCNKTSIVFSTEDKPGSLYRVLDIFNLWDVNMVRIESRPAKNQLGNYIFFIDIEGHYDDPELKDALTMIKRKTSFYKLLGSYPRYQE
ncbi:MAG: prephenate dehydratase [Bacillota bacterium]|nr:prephenate dehydratase [Bacillota bacterium]